MGKVFLGNVKGATGADGYSPRIDVVSDTDEEYILRFTTKDGTFTTPNLKGSGGSSAVETGVIQIPYSFPAIPMEFYRDIDNKISHNFSFSQFKDGYEEIYVNSNSAVGNDTTGDGSSSKPFRTMQKAINVAEEGSGDSYIIKLAESIITRTYAQVDKTITKNISIVSTRDTRTILTTGSEYLTWTQDGEGTWKATRSTVYGVYGIKETDSHGEPVFYDNVVSVAECQATPGTWYTDNTTVWVHTTSGTIPICGNSAEATHAVCLDVNLMKLTLGNATLYLENICFLGARPNNGVNILGDETNSASFIVNNCSFSGGNLRRDAISRLGNALAVNSVKNTYIFDSVAFWGGRDGFNYHFESIPVARRRECIVVEYNCLSYNNGLYSTSGADNATTCHEGVCIIRIGCTGQNTGGPVLADVHGCLSYIVDCHMRDAIGGSGNTKSAYYFDNDSAAEEGKAWLINSSGGGDNYSLSAEDGFAIYMKKFSGSNIPAGLNISYI